LKYKIYFPTPGTEIMHIFPSYLVTDRALNTGLTLTTSINFHSISLLTESRITYKNLVRLVSFLAARHGYDQRTTQELMSPGYDTYRRDREDGYGGVLVAISSQVYLAFLRGRVVILSF
jgi:hypothetical protein